RLRAARSRPASCPCLPRAASLRPACRPLQPTRCLLLPVRRPLQPAHFLLAARSLHLYGARLLPALRAAPLWLLFAFLRIDHEGRPIQFDTWLDNLQLYLLSDSRDNVLLFDHTSGAAPAPPATAECGTRSQWLTRDAAARLAIRNHQPLAECAHFGQHRTAQALYDAVVSRYSSHATVALGRLLQPYLFPKLSAFATVEDLVSHLCTSNACYRAALPAEFLAKNPPPIVVAVGAARGTPRTAFFEGCSPSPLAAAADVPGAEDVDAASASAKRRSSKRKGGRGGGDGSGGGGGGSSGGGGGGGGGGTVGVVAGVGALVAAVEAAVGLVVVAAVGVVAVRLELSVEVMEEARGSTSSVEARPCHPSSFTCGKLHTQHRCFSSLNNAWRVEFGDEAERPRWAELLRSGAAIFDLDYDAILAAMYGLFFSAKGDCYLCVTPDPGIEAAPLGASEFVLPGTAPAKALHTFTLDSDASRCFFRDSTTLTPLSAPVPVRLADPSRGPILARSSTVLQCPAVPSGSLSGLHLPLSSTNLVSTAAMQDAMVTTTTPRGQVAPPCSCRLFSHQTLLWHQRLGHPSLPCLCGMHSRLLVSRLPRSLPPLPPSPAPPCLPCVEGRQRAAPHSSSFPPTTAPLQTLHMDVCGPARVNGQGRERYFPWLLKTTCVRLQLRERFRTHLPVLRLHSDRGGEFSSDLLRDFCCGESILQSFTLPDSPQQNGIAEGRISLVMEVARTSMIHVAAPNFLWPFAVRYAAHKLNLWPRVSFSEISPTLRWTGKDVTFDESVPFYHLFPYRSAPPSPPPLFLAPGPPLVDPLPPWVAAGSGATRGAASGGAASGGAEPEGAEPRGAEPGGAESKGAGSGGAEPGGEESEGAGYVGAEPWGAETEGAERAGVEGTMSGGAELRGTASSGATGAGDCAGGDTGAGGAGVTGAAAGPGGARTGGTGAAGIGGVGGAGAGDPTEPGAARAGGAGAVDAGAGGIGAGGTGAGGAGAVDPGGGGAGGNVWLQPYFVPLLQQVLGVPSSTGLTPPLLCPLLDQSQPPLQPASPLLALSPYTEQISGLTERRETASCPASPVRTVRRVPRPHHPPVPNTHAMTLRVESRLSNTPPHTRPKAHVLPFLLSPHIFLTRSPCCCPCLCQRSTDNPRLILGKGYRLVVLGGYGRTDPLLNKPFYPNGAGGAATTMIERQLEGCQAKLEELRGELHFAEQAGADVEAAAGDPGIVVGLSEERDGGGGGDEVEERRIEALLAVIEAAKAAAGDSGGDEVEEEGSEEEEEEEDEGEEGEEEGEEAEDCEEDWEEEEEDVEDGEEERKEEQESKAIAQNEHVSNGERCSGRAAGDGGGGNKSSRGQGIPPSQAERREVGPSAS
ncbi:unnamed protein product, partial [Closterium sp. NIES-54]